MLRVITLALGALALAAPAAAQQACPDEHYRRPKPQADAAFRLLYAEEAGLRHTRGEVMLAMCVDMSGRPFEIRATRIDGMDGPTVTRTIELFGKLAFEPARCGSAVMQDCTYEMLVVWEPREDAVPTPK